MMVMIMMMPLMLMMMLLADGDLRGWIAAGDEMAKMAR